MCKSLSKKRKFLASYSNAPDISKLNRPTKQKIMQNQIFKCINIFTFEFAPTSVEITQPNMTLYNRESKETRDETKEYAGVVEQSGWIYKAKNHSK